MGCRASSAGRNGSSTTTRISASTSPSRTSRAADPRVASPAAWGPLRSLGGGAGDTSRRPNRLFLAGPDGRRPVFGGTEKFQRAPHWRGLPLFYEYFHGDNGAGLGASHQTGWTGVVAQLLSQSGEQPAGPYRRQRRPPDGLRHG